MIESAMAIAVHSSISSTAALSGCSLPIHCQTCHTEDFGCVPLFGTIGCRSILCEGRRSAFGINKHTGLPRAIRFDSGNHSFGPSDSFPFSRRKILRQIKVRVAADYSKSGAFEYGGESGYHPLEELRECEKSEDLRLSDAEIARTTVEANENAILIFSGMVHREPHEDISWAELHYVIDDYGDIYIEVNNDENILRSPRASNPVNVLIGLDDIELYREQKRRVNDDDNNFNAEDNSDSDVRDAYEEDWSSIIQKGDDSDLSEPLGNWSKIDTMNTVHPMYFANKMAKVVSTDYSEKMDRPSNGLAIIGLIRPAFMEEESYVRKFFYGEDFSSTDDNCTEDEDQLNNEPEEATTLYDSVGNSSRIENPNIVEQENMSSSEDLDVSNYSARSKDELFAESFIPKDNEPDLMSLILPEDDASWAIGLEKDEGSGISSSLYKLEILSIQLVSVYGNESIVSLQDFQQAEPDILAHSASTIIARVNAGGERTERALKALCWKKKGLQVEEAILIGVDSLGVDLRVHCGAQVQTLRFAFNCQATSEDAAERKLRRLLFPRFRNKRRKPRRDCRQNS
eukprot:Gb_40253 [translate_table: standard]